MEGQLRGLFAKQRTWLEIFSFAGFGAIAFVLAEIEVTKHASEYKDIVQAFGHLFITIMAIIIIRKYEVPRIENEREYTINLIKQKYDLLSQENQKNYHDLLKNMQSNYENLLVSSLPLLHGASKIGLVHVHKTRSDARKSIENAIGKTRHTLLMLGVALEETFSIREQCAHIANHFRQSNMQDPAHPVHLPKIRFLCLNPFTTPAVIRSFLESWPADAASFLSEETTASWTTVAGDPIPDGILNYIGKSTLYLDFCRAFDSFTMLRKQGTPCDVRYYRRDPNVWMLITDDSIFVEPYTFGQPSIDPDTLRSSLRMGGHMPVLEFDRKNSAVCSILQDHFDRLWEISQDNMASLGTFRHSPRGAAEKFLHDVFAIRRDILEALVEMLMDSDGEQRPI